MGIRRPSISTDSGEIDAVRAAATAAKASAGRRRTGTTRPNISAATIAPRVSVSSGSEKISAAGARPAIASSSSTPDPEQEPRLVGIRTTAPASETPCRGWCTSMTIPVAASTPPQKLNPSSMATTGPRAVPVRMLIPPLIDDDP